MSIHKNASWTTVQVGHWFLSVYYANSTGHEIVSIWRKSMDKIWLPSGNNLSSAKNP